MALDESTDEDVKEEYKDLSFTYEKRLSRFLEEAIIDYIDSGWGQGLTIRTDFGMMSMLDTRTIKKIKTGSNSSSCC